ncbi:MAG: hypothetical protein Q8K66_06945 [Sediminibacterium sp.]|nr:hypothetical protein [Sediminibacterium sp.]MDP3128630.1 hypothetical protein [Sediminibacterium sp.]
MNASTIETSKKRRIITILLIINCLLFFTAVEFGLFKGDRGYIFMLIPLLTTASIIALSIKYKLASWKIFVVYLIIAAAFIIMQFI